MSKPFYEDYATHAMRFYSRNPAIKMNDPGLKLADVENWHACEDALRNFSELDRTILIEVFRCKCAIDDAVSCISAQFDVKPNTVWQLMNNFSNVFAKYRGLL